MYSIFSSGWLTKLASLFGKTKWQQRYLLANNTTSGTVTDIADLRFSNLEIGKTYRIYGQLDCIFASDPSSGTLRSYHDGQVLATVSTKGTTVGGNDRGTVSMQSAPFVATTTTVTTDYVSDGTTIISAAVSNPTFLVLEELPNHEQTTDWT